LDHSGCFTSLFKQIIDHYTLSSASCSHLIKLCFDFPKSFPTNVLSTVQNQGQTTQLLQNIEEKRVKIFYGKLARAMSDKT
jgi:hypothetical protein